MDRINGANTVDIGSGRRGFRDVNTVTGVAGTEVTALWLNMLQEEMAAVILDAGIVLDPADWGQLLKALRSRSANRPSWVSVISMTVTAPPGAPAIGDRYMVPPGATGVWAGHAYEIAEWAGATWIITNHPDGHGISLPDGRVFIQIAGVYVEKLALDAQSKKWSYVAAGGTANALTATLAPAPQALTIGMEANVQIISPNSITNPTLNVNGLSPGATIIGNDGSAIPLNALVPGLVASLRWDGANWRLTSYTALQSPPRNTVVYSTPGTYSFTVPAGIYKIFGKVWGAGGGSGGCNGAANAGGGGGSGEYREGWIDVVPGQVITIIVGANGVAGIGANSGTAGTGGTSSIGAYISSLGGRGGTNGAGAGGLGGSGGFGGSFGVGGGNGYSGGYIAGNTALPFGGAGAPSFQQSLIMPSLSGGSIAGYGPGSGASGATSQSGAVAGSAGAAGQVIIQY